MNSLAVVAEPVAEEKRVAVEKMPLPWPQPKYAFRQKTAAGQAPTTPVPIGAIPIPPENPVTVAEMARATPPPCCSSVYGHREPSSASVSAHDPGPPCCNGTQGPSTLKTGCGALELNNPGGSQKPATLAPYPNPDVQQTRAATPAAAKYQNPRAIERGRGRSGAGGK